jgi:hypothetical protein
MIYLNVVRANFTMLVATALTDLWDKREIEWAKTSLENL